MTPKANARPAARGSARRPARARGAASGTASAATNGAGTPGTIATNGAANPKKAGRGSAKPAAAPAEAATRPDDPTAVPATDASAPSGASTRTAEQIIAELSMIPIEGDEGGWYAPGPQVAGLSSITVLLTHGPEGFSAMHRLTVNEGWQWLDGAPAVMLQLDPGGRGHMTMLAPRYPQAIVPRGTWQGTATLGEWTLFSCWCAPEFSPSRFLLGERDLLVADYPDFETEIRALTRPTP